MRYLKFIPTDTLVKELKHRDAKEIVKHVPYEALCEVTKDLFSMIDDKDVLYLEVQKTSGRPTGRMWHQGKQISQDVAENMQRDALTFANSDLWRLLKNDARYVAGKTIYNKSRGETDLIAGKMLLYAVNMLDKKIQQLKQFTK